MTDNTLQTRLHTTVLRVTNLERSVAWYTEKLGLTVTYEDVHYRLIMLRDRGESQMSLWELRPGETPTSSGKESIYPVFVSGNARSDHQALTERGVNPSPIKDYPHGLRLFWLKDPDDHRLCVIEFLPE